MNKIRINIEDNYNLENGSAAIAFAGLKRFNEETMGDGGHRQIAVYAHREGEVVGGLLGITKWNWLHVDLLWVADVHRKSGIGSELMVAAENEARKRGCHHAHLETTELQAPGFYAKLGYTLFGTLENYPCKLYFFQKAL
jgi:GNAT superfamily N-acetyltransferase